MDIAKGMPVRSECTLCDASVLGSDIILRMLIALTDLMSNPATREDYGNAPVALHGIFESMELYEITVKNVYPIVMDYCSQIPNAIKKL